MSHRWRVFRPSNQWAKSGWKNKQLETCWIPICIPSSAADLLFFLQKTFGETPYISIHHSVKAASLQIPTSSSYTSCHVISTFDGNGFACKTKVVADAAAKFPIMSILIRGLVPNTGRNESYWVQVDPDTQKRRTTGKETLICQYFKDHPLAELNLLFVIISFL